MPPCHTNENERRARLHPRTCARHCRSPSMRPNARNHRWEWSAAKFPSACMALLASFEFLRKERIDFRIGESHVFELLQGFLCLLIRLIRRAWRS